MTYAFRTSTKAGLAPFHSVRNREGYSELAEVVACSGDNGSDRLGSPKEKPEICAVQGHVFDVRFPQGVGLLTTDQAR
jgi:hypothetical protein